MNIATPPVPPTGALPPKLTPPNGAPPNEDPGNAPNGLSATGVFALGMGKVKDCPDLPKENGTEAADELPGGFIVLKKAPPLAGASDDTDGGPAAALPEPLPKPLDDPNTGAVPDPKAPVDNVLAVSPDDSPPKLAVPEEPKADDDLPNVELPKPPLELDADDTNGLVGV